MYTFWNIYYYLHYTVLYVSKKALMQLINKKTAYCTISKNKLPTNSTKYPDIWTYPNFLITQRRTSRRKVTCIEPCELFNRFDRTPTCDRQTDKHRAIASTRAYHASPAIVLRRFLTQSTATTVMMMTKVSTISVTAITSVKSAGTPPFGSAACSPDNSSVSL